MPNYCVYNMKVTGRQEDVDQFIKELQVTDYSYNDYGCSGIEEGLRHLCRVFSADVIYDIPNKIKIDVDNSVILRDVILSGDCAWSVASCMTDSPTSYYNQLRERYGNRSKATTLKLESKILNLIIEVYSEEPGCCFSEHMLYVNGEEIIDECVDYYETWEDEDGNELDDPIIEGGYDSWDFTSEYDRSLAKTIFDKHGGTPLCILEGDEL